MIATTEYVRVESIGATVTDTTEVGRGEMRGRVVSVDLYVYTLKGS